MPLEIFPLWTDEADDQRVQNMLGDILDSALDESFWDVQPSVHIKSKRKAEAVVVIDQRTSKHPKPSSRSKEHVKKKQEAEKKKRQEINEEISDSIADSTTLMEVVQVKRKSKKEEKQKQNEASTLIEALQGLTKAFEGMRADQSKLADRLLRLEENRPDVSLLNERISMLERNNFDHTILLERLVRLEENRAAEPVLTLEDKKGDNEGRGETPQPSPHNMEKDLNSVCKALFE